MSQWKSAFAKYLIFLLENEKLLESKRILLSEIPEYEPYTVFQRLDRTNKKFLISEDLISFLDIKRKNEDLKETFDYIIKHYDIDSDQALNFTEFLRIFLPITDSHLRAKVTQRNVFRVGPDDLLIEDIENLMHSILTIEKNLVEKIYEKSKALKFLIDFSIENIFNYLDILKDSHLTEDSLITFLRKNLYNISNLDSKLLFNRLDANMDGKICYSDFMSIFPEKKNKICIKNISNELNIFKKLDSNNFSDKKNFSMSNQEYYNTMSTKKSYFQSRDNSNNSQINSSQFYSRISLKLDEGCIYDTLVLTYFKKIILLSSKAEDFKDNLALNANTHIINIFKIFDVNEHQNISEENFKFTLNNLNIFITNEELKLLFRRYDLDGNNILSLYEFTEMISSSKEEYVNLLNDSKFLENKISQNGIVYLASLIRYLIEKENQIQNLRNIISDRPKFMVGEAFEMLKNKIKNYIIKNDVIIDKLDRNFFEKEKL